MGKYLNFKLSCYLDISISAGHNTLLRGSHRQVCIIPVSDVIYFFRVLTALTLPTGTWLRAEGRDNLPHVPDRQGIESRGS